MRNKDGQRQTGTLAERQAAYAKADAVFFWGQAACGVAIAAIVVAFVAGLL